MRFPSFRKAVSIAGIVAFNAALWGIYVDGSPIAADVPRLVKRGFNGMGIPSLVIALINFLKDLNAYVGIHLFINIRVKQVLTRKYTWYRIPVFQISVLSKSVPSLGEIAFATYNARDLTRKASPAEHSPLAMSGGKTPSPTLRLVTLPLHLARVEASTATL